MTPPTVFIVDDDPAITDSLGLLLETAGIAVECHANAESFLASYQEEGPGCLVLDVRMKHMSGPELHAELIRRGSKLPVIFLTAHGDIPMTVNAMRAGAMDFLTKPVDGALLLGRVQAALEQSGQSFEREEALKGKRQRLADLTRREQEVMMMVLTGQSNKSIAKQLGISYRTVETHRSHLLRKTETVSMLELAQLVAECGFTMDDADPRLPAAALEAS